MSRALLIIAVLSFGAMGAETEGGRNEAQPQMTPAVLVRPSESSRQILHTISRPAVVGTAVVEPLSKRSVEYQIKTRTLLRWQLNRIFPTVDTPRGLVVNIPASLLSSGYDLSREASEKIARIAEMLPPDVEVRAEGYTDDRGSAKLTLGASSGVAET